MKSDFDSAALTYDTDFTNTHIGKMQRDRVWSYLNQFLSRKENLNVLELNCGTGEDAIKLAGKGHKVTASDISENMLEVARSKKGADQVNFVTIDITQIAAHIFEEPFDLIFSNFGGLNCIDPLSVPDLSTNLHKLLSPSGSFIAVIMPDRCLWEEVYFLLKGKVDEAFRRTKDFALANVSGQKVKTWYFSPKKHSELMSEEFEMKKVRPIGFFIPPSYLEHYFLRHVNFLRRLNWLEQKIGGLPWLASFSDHYLIHYEIK